MTYEECLHFLYEQLPMFSRIGPAAYKKDIGNTQLLCDLLKNPQEKFKSIHIAGTNGKGSTSHMLAAILQNAGYKTGLYTSPHIRDFRERIRINGNMVPKEFVCSFTENIISHLEHIKPSFFELTVAMAFEYFAQESVDIAIIETGLGGRLDSTNIITPVLSVITNISFDHVALLGNTLQEIASEKAGIIKPGIPVVLGEATPETWPIFETTAIAMGSEITRAESYYTCKLQTDKNITAQCIVTNKKIGNSTTYQLGLTGKYQSMNCCTVLTSIDSLRNHGFSIADTHIRNGLLQVKELTGLRGRWDVLEENPLLIADVAHNEAGLKHVIDQLETEYRGRNLHFILGFVQDKELHDILRLFPISASYYFTQASIPRALPAKELAEIAQTIPLHGTIHTKINEAIAVAKKKAAPHDIIMICGSFFILAEIEETLFNSNRIKI